MNFISNGIKYSSKERNSFVKITVEVTDDFIILIFKDNGLGIDLEKHGNKLFGIYKTFHEHEDSRGVGLFITKNQVESMGGRIEVQSEVNVGTTFKIFLKNEKN
jgi:signal transduction histidine kinase